MLSKEGYKNLQKLKEGIKSTWGEKVHFTIAQELPLPVDAFRIEILVYGKYKILVEYEGGTFAYKLWSGAYFEYLDSLVDEKIVYGFKSMLQDNIVKNFAILDRYLQQKMKEQN